MNRLIESIRKSFSAFSKMPFLFVWSSLMYLFLFGALMFTGVGFAMMFLIAMSILDQPVSLASPTTVVAFGLIAFLVVFLSNGLNAALARAYHSACWKERTSLTAFFNYSLSKSGEMFGIMLVRDLAWLVLCGPAIAVFVYYLSDVQLMDALLGIYLLFMTFALHLLFTPAFISAGAFGADLRSSLKQGIALLRRRHIFFIGLYALFAFAWLLNFVPFVNIVSVFFLYPLMYSSMITLMEDTVKFEG